MSEKTLEQQLKEFGFIDVTGMLEGSDGRMSYWVPVVKPTERLRWGHNNGVYCVVDEHGHSWIISARAKIDFSGFFRNIPRLGVSVPFSNDGGYYVRNIWPWLYE